MSPCRDTWASCRWDPPTLPRGDLLLPRSAAIATARGAAFAAAVPRHGQQAPRPRWKVLLFRPYLVKGRWLTVIPGQHIAERRGHVVLPQLGRRRDRIPGRWATAHLGLWKSLA